MVKVKGPKRPLRRLKVGSAMLKSLKEFLAKTAVHACRYLVEDGRMQAEKIMWAIIHIVMTIASIYIVKFAWTRFTENPTITTLESQHHSIFGLKFPAVAICPNNKISKLYAERYADHLMTSHSLPRSYRSRERLLPLIRYMGRLYDADIEGIDEFGTFQEILDQVDSNKTTGVFNSNEKLNFLAPKCEDFMIKCKWGGKFLNCSQLFDYRLTSEGFCCTFNYVRVGDGYETRVEPRSPAGIGSDQGLTVLMNLSMADYYYPLKNFAGATALIFDPNEYADSATGSVREVPVDANDEIRVTLNMNTKVAVQEVQRYTIEMRECMFGNDLKEEWRGKYEYGDCLSKCKLRSIIALCKCKTFNLPDNFWDIETKDVPYCSLANIQCLNKYRIKWLTYKPREAIKGLEREMEDSLDCNTCYPLCSSSTYIVDSTSTKLNFNYVNKGSVISNMNESMELSVLKVYFPQADSILYQTTVLYAWYDIVSDYGGILSLCLGCSIISFIELFYFMTVRFYQNLFNSQSFIGKFNNKQKANVFENGMKIVRPRLEYIH